jgi:hypothetical protein
VISIHRQIFSALDLIVHIDRMPGGRRVVTQISEATAIDPDTNRATVTDIFNYRDGVSLQPTGYLPTFIDELIDNGLLDLEFLYAGDRQMQRRPAGNGAPLVAPRKEPRPPAPQPAATQPVAQPMAGQPVAPQPAAANGGAPVAPANPTDAAKPAETPAASSNLSSLINQYLK